MRLKEITVVQEAKSGTARLWSARITVKTPNYVGSTEAQVWAENSWQARRLLALQYGMEDHRIGPVREVR